MRTTVVLLGLLTATVVAPHAAADDGKAPAVPPAAATPPTRAPAAAPAARPHDHLLSEILEIRNAWTKTRSADAPPPETAADRGREQIGRLVYSKLTLELEEVRLTDALRALRRELGLNMTLFTLDPRGATQRPGFDGEQLVSVSLRDVDGRTALETLVSFAGKDTTWQLHNGVIEVGPREHLARPEAREMRVYETTDLAIDPPDWKPERRPDGTIRAVEVQRRNSDEVIGELVQMIVRHCEPDAFLPPPATRVEESTGRVVPRQHATPGGDGMGKSTGKSTGAGRGGSGRRSPNSGATANFDPAEGQVFVTGRWASIQMKDNNLAVLAPDFVHRAINGYPRPIPPPAAE